jgi:hypothetical protein
MWKGRGRYTTMGATRNVVIFEKMEGGGGYLQVALGYSFILCFNRLLVWCCVPSGGVGGTEEYSDRTEDKGQERGQFRYITASLCSHVLRQWRSKVFCSP